MPLYKRPKPASLPSALPLKSADPAIAAIKPVRRAALGKAFKLPASIVLPEHDGTDYRKVVQRYQAKVKNPKSAIRAKCVECSGGSLKEVQMCAVKTCALHPFRLGINPHNKKTKERLAKESGEDVGNEGEEDEIEEGEENAN